jgi:hypothetical protein
LKERDTRRQKKAGMKSLRHIARCSLLDYSINEDILEELKADPVKKKSAQYKKNG